MTFCIGFATRDAALVAADTRVQDLGGAAYDTVDVTFTNPLGGPAIPFPATFRKIRQLRGRRPGWIASAGVAQFTAMMFQQVERRDAGDIPGLADAIAAAHRAFEPALIRRYPDQAASLRSRLAIAPFLVVHANEAGCECHLINATGEVEPQTRVRADWPVECAAWRDGDRDSLLSAYESDIQRRAGRADLLRMTAELFHTVYRVVGPNGTMSDLVEIGLLRLGSDGAVAIEHLPPTECRVVMDASEDDLAGRLETL
jgi:hypothetical protein